MQFSLGNLFGGKDAAGAKKEPTEAQIRQQAAQGGGTDPAKDNVAREDRRRRAMRLVGRQVAMKRVREDSGVGRVNAPSKKRH